MTANDWTKSEVALVRRVVLRASEGKDRFELDLAGQPEGVRLHGVETVARQVRRGVIELIDVGDHSLTLRGTQLLYDALEKINGGEGKSPGGD